MNQPSIEHIISSIVSPEEIIAKSHGEVVKADGIFPRSRVPVTGGLFCQTVFGPIRDYECLCGKYRSPEYAGMVCPTCHVEVAPSKVRKERFGHIGLFAPAARRDCLETEALLLDVDPEALDRVIYDADYIVTDPGNAEALGVRYKQIMDNDTRRKLREEHPDVSFTALTGAAAVEKLLRDLSSETSGGTVLQMEYERVREERRTADEERAAYLDRRLEVIGAFLHSDRKPEWMILHVLPVLPADLRPDGLYEGVNDLYRKVLVRNNRLRKLEALESPRIIVLNEQRILQETVDSLLAEAELF